MKLTRRGFLKSAPAVPVVLSTMKPSVEQLTGIAAIGPAADDHGPGYIPGHDRSIRQRLYGLFKTGGIPEWKRQQMRRRARQSRSIDIDIAMLRSVSLQHKLRMQWDRNEARWLEDELSNWERELSKISWMRAAGFKEEDDDYY